MNPVSNPQQTPRQQAISLAWQIVRAARLPFKKAQSQAWATVRLLNQMKTGPAEFSYLKEDRSQRTAIGENPTPVPDKPLVIRYFDLEAGGIRSFRVDRLVTA